MMRQCRLALRDWDWLTPLLLQEVDCSELEALDYSLHIDRVPQLVNLRDSVIYDGAEVSLSNHSRRVMRGDTRVEALAHPLMQGPRHRCVLVRADSSASCAAELAGARIGVTGWADSGIVWARAALADDGLVLEEANWFAGRLTAQHAETDRVGEFARSGRVQGIGGKPMIDRLADGELDAVITPFIPQGVLVPESPFRPLYRDTRAVEREWLARRGYVPCHHLLAFRAEVPHEVRHAVSALLRESRRAWRRAREKLAETTLWSAVDLWDEAQTLPSGWDEPGLRQQRRGLQGFFEASLSQGLLESIPRLDQIFPLDTAAPLIRQSDAVRPSDRGSPPHLPTTYQETARS